MLPTARPDVVFMDYAMPAMNGAETSERALALCPDLKIITLSMFGDNAYYSRMVSSGAKGFLLKDSEFDEVVEAVETVHAGGTYFSASLLKSLSHSIRSAAAGGDAAAAVAECDRCRTARWRFWLRYVRVSRLRRSPIVFSSPNAPSTSTAPTFWKRAAARTPPASSYTPSATVWWRCKQNTVRRTDSQNLSSAAAGRRTESAIRRR